MTSLGRGAMTSEDLIDGAVGWDLRADAVAASSASCRETVVDGAVRLDLTDDSE